MHTVSITQSDLNALRSQLIERGLALRADMQAATAARQAHEAGGEVKDLKDQAADWLQTEVQDAEVLRDIHELTLIEQALRRMGDGTYGECAECGEPISMKRLRALPAALRCATCQAAVERR